MLHTRDLARDYGQRHALQGVTLDVRAGEVVALLGPNGAGKSTLLNILAGTLRATSGTADVAGLRLPGDEARLGRVVGFVPQGESTYPELTVLENLRLFARLHGVPRRDAAARADALLRDVALADRRDERAGALSGGLRQRLALACSLAHEPRVLLLDEPGTGLDPAARERLGGLVRRFRGADRAVLLSTHSLEEAARVADRVVFLVAGRIRASLPASQAHALEPAFREVGEA
ncbi:MAG TPA: ABC transporter ATP-binding protein [Candidatus Thermoplasmatota archaeon]|nr:ABC transporter ATP-binding protein [Candidatus Thermoplasmatota archaeon]